MSYNPGRMPTEPVAYFITFSTYGSRLHGDPRGSVHHSLNQLGEPGMPPGADWRSAEESRLVNSGQRLDSQRRPLVLAAIERTCELREWRLWSVNVRTNHVHVVVSATVKPESVMNSLKAWATRSLTEACLLSSGTKLWTRHGSTRYLWTDDDVVAACDYVRDGQGADIPGSVRPPPEP